MADTNAVELRDPNCVAHFPEVERGHSAVVEQPCRDLGPSRDGGCCYRQTPSIDPAAVAHPGEGGADPDWSEVVVRIHNGDSSGMEELYKVLSKGVRFFLYRQLGPRDLDDKVHDIFVLVAQAIQP
jgi:hypothetical protein